MTQMNLGNALATLGERESETGKLEEAVAAYREALEELTKEAAPRWHDMAQRNLHSASALLAQRLEKLALCEKLTRPCGKSRQSDSLAACAALESDMTHISGFERSQLLLLPEAIDDS